MKQVRENIGAEIRRRLDEGMGPSEIAKVLGVSRQLVHYHKSDKSHRRRGNMDPERLARVRARANRYYSDRALKGLLDD